MEEDPEEVQYRQMQVENWLDHSNTIAERVPPELQPIPPPPPAAPLPPPPQVLPLPPPPPPQVLPPPPPQPLPTEGRTDIQELAMAITKLSQRAEGGLTRQLVDLPSFNGACEEWLAFRRSYEDTARSFTPAQNLARLRRCLQGHAREAVKSLLFTAEDPEELMKSLEVRFGRPGAIALAELKKMERLPRVNESSGEICMFASRVRNAVATIRALGKTEYLCAPGAVECLIEKMPPTMKSRWLMYQRERRAEGKPALELMYDFMEVEADINSDYAPPEVSWDQKRNMFKRPVHHVQQTEGRREEPKTDAKKCPECREDHWLYECKKYKEASVEDKWEMVKKARMCFKCLRFKHSRNTCRAQPCKKCMRWHHISLHSEKPAAAKTQEKPAEGVVSSVHTTSCGKAYLKMTPVNLYGPKGTAKVLALLDEGSTVTLLDSSVAKKIGAQGKPEAITIEMVGGNGMQKSNSQKINMKIKGVHCRNKLNMEARTIDNLKLAKQGVEERMLQKCKHLQKIKDKLVYDKEEPQLLIGQDNWGLIVTRRLRKGKASEPVASLTSLGWVLHGCDTGGSVPVKFVHHSRLMEDETEALVRRHFEIESLGVQARRPSNDADKRALDVLEKTTKRLPNGRFESGLLWKNERETLPNNYHQAHQRLINMEKKLDKDPALKTSYEEQIENLLKNGYAEKAPETTTPGRTFYLPHFAVMHPIKKKPRIVLDAAAKFNGKSLNDALLPGPDLLQSLFGVLLRFREDPVAVVADIKEMFLRIQMREEDRDSLRFLWRGSKRNGKPEEYRMASVIFGATSSPSTAIYVMNKNAEDFKEEHPAAVAAIRRNHYMDDYLQSFTTVEEAKRIAKEVQTIHNKASFHLRGWGSNQPTVLEGIEDQRQEEVLELGKEEKTLGLRWLITEDALAFNVGFRNTPPEVLAGPRVPTKREVTSAVMSTFDPMGFATPILIQGQKLIQEIWRTKIDWDEKILEPQVAAWTGYLEDVAVLKELKIPRCLSPRTRRGQLHTFCDASEEAYAAAVYWRTEDPDGTIRVALIAGKARVAPSKPVSIPRLELQAALLGSRLASSVEKELDLEIEERTFWTDSSTVLQWLKADPRKFKTFVAHRLAEIEELTRIQDWRWVPTKENPADDATRGTPNEFDENARWFKGPAFLYGNKEDWPARRFEVKEELTGEEKNPQVVATLKVIPQVTPDPKRFSDWTRLLRSTARIFQFIDLLRRRVAEKRSVHIVRHRRWKKTPSHVPREKKEEKVFLTLEDKFIHRAEEELIKRSQQESFSKELCCLEKGRPLENSSRLKKIDIYLDGRGILKLRTRTRKIGSGEGRTNPIILDGKSQICRLIIGFYHKRFYHGNSATIINEIRQKFWVLGLRSTTRWITHGCQWCRVHKGEPQIPPTGDFPAERLQHHQPPFTCTAVDYFGPMQVTIGRRTEKRWGALFTCLTTRAIHLELANSLSTSSMIMALRRMAARRGTPKIIFSDNGTNFVGANRELQEAASREGITWRFIPPGCPNMGGAWERMVRSVKTSLMTVLKEKSPPEEVLHTLLLEVEHIVNSRPLTHISMDPEDEESLTPNHFLIGRSCGAMAPGVFEDHDLIGKANWRTAQRLTDHFWQRWLKEYLPTLMPRKIAGRETEDPQVGDVVLIVDTTLPRNTWPREEVLRVYPGPDGRVRILNVRTPGGVLRQPTRRVVVLVPAKTSHPEEGVLRTAGENVSDVKNSQD
ncbi:uncharacterized protein LOC135087291 [Ostrinia nubilalis]|uniref:uncharacterized protein LOC135087291 n=1 Tax=Ostrinia nubilalis TaxID=29057 RepID=UPI0030825136